MKLDSPSPPGPLFVLEIKTVHYFKIVFILYYFILLMFFYASSSGVFMIKIKTSTKKEVMSIIKSSVCFVKWNFLDLENNINNINVEKPLLEFYIQCT